jgi:hypothetical protein
MFYENYKKKSNDTLIEIFNSDSYQLTARETAQKILEERKANYRIKDDKPELIELNAFELFDKLESYGLNVYTSKRKRLVEIYQSNNGMLIGLILLPLSFICLIVLSTSIIQAFNGTSVWNSGARAYIWKGWLTGAITFFVAGIMNYQKDKKSKARLKFNDNRLEIKQRKIWKQESFDLKLNETDIEFKKKKKRYIVFIRQNNRHIELFDFRDNNVGNKIEDYLNILIEKYREEGKAVGNNV